MANGVGAIKFTRLPRPTWRGPPRVGGEDATKSFLAAVLGLLPRDMPPGGWNGLPSGCQGNLCPTLRASVTTPWLQRMYVCQTDAHGWAKNGVDSHQYRRGWSYHMYVKSGIRECGRWFRYTRTSTRACGPHWRERPCWIQYQHSLHSPRVFCSARSDTYLMGHPASGIAHVRVIRAPDRYSTSIVMTEDRKYGATRLNLS